MFLWADLAGRLKKRQFQDLDGEKFPSELSGVAGAQSICRVLEADMSVRLGRGHFMP